MSSRFHTRLCLAMGIIGVLASASPSAATLLVYDPFLTGSTPAAGEYSIGTLGGQNPTIGPTAFYSGGWVEEGGSPSVVQASGLSYPGAPTAGGSTLGVEMGGIVTARNGRQFATPWDSSTTGTFYLSFLANFGTDDNPANPNHYRAFEMWNGGINDGFRVLSLGYSSFGNFPSMSEMGLAVQGTSQTLDNPPEFATDGMTHLLVFKFDLSSAPLSDTVSVFLDPVSPVEPGGPNASVSSLDFLVDRHGAMTQFSFSMMPGPAVLDEIRIGTTFGDVAPLNRLTSNLIGLFVDWTNPAVWSTSPLFPNDGNGGFTYDVVINNGGQVTISNGTSIVIQGLAVNNGSIISDGSLETQGEASWTGGTLSGAGTFEFAGATVLGGSGKSFFGTIINSGTMTWQEGLINCFFSGGLDASVHNTGTFELAGNGTSFVLNSGSPVFVNETTGTMRRLPAPGIATIDVATTNHGIVEVQSSTLEFTRGLANSDSGTVAGSGTIIGAVTNGGRLSPGVLPGETAILTITGSYEQLASGVLAIDVGGLAPGPGHDQLVVDGMPGIATLAGRLELSIVNSFMPMEDDEITFLTAVGVNGTFDSIFSPNLATAAPGRAILLTYNPGGPGMAGDVRATFVMPGPGGFLNSPAPTSEWSTPGTFAVPPNSTHVVELQNFAAIPQRVEVATQSAFSHQLTVTGASPVNTMTVGVIEGRSLSATASVTIGQNAAVELVGGNLVSATVEVGGGGRLSGNGTVVGALQVGTAAGPGQATLSPGLSVGHLEVVGSYEQGGNGLLMIDVDGTTEGEFDTVNVTGTAATGGALVFDATNLPVGTGGTFEFLTAGSLVPPGEMLEATFQSVETIGNDDVFVALSFGGLTDGAGGGSLDGNFNASGNICPIGDMNCKDGVNMDDVPLFARALRTPTTYHIYFWNTFLPRLMIFANDAGNVDGSNNGLDFDDIDDFAMMVAGSGAASFAEVLAAIDAEFHAVPEPMAAAMLVSGGWMLLAIGSVRPWRSEQRCGYLTFPDGE